MKIYSYIFIIGFFTGTLIGGVIFVPEKTKLITDIIQSIVFISATIFTAWWTSMTYGRDHKIKEANSMNELLDSLATAAGEKYFHEKVKNNIRKDVLNQNQEKFSKVGLEKAHLFLSAKYKIDKTLHLYKTINHNIIMEIKNLCSVEGKEIEDEKIFQDFIESIVVIQKNILDDAYFDFRKEMKKVIL